MDICSHIGLSVNEVTSLHGFCVGTLESTFGVLGDFSMDELGYGVTKFLDIQDDTEEVLGSIPPHNNCVFQTDVREEVHRSEVITGAHEKLFSKCATFSCSSKINKTIRYADDITDEILMHNDSESVNPDCSDSVSLPLVSAMKGSREKRGLTPPKKLSVKWAPDVYDPVPTSLAHMISNRPRKHNKKKSKNKQKNGSNKSSRGESKGKGKDRDKKQARKRETSFELFEPKEEIICFSEIQPSAMDFHVGIPDLFCGSSFVNRYGSDFHLSVAEAT